MTGVVVTQYHLQALKDLCSWECLINSHVIIIFLPLPCESMQDGLASYSCVCPPGFSGVNCEVNVNECEEMDIDCPGNSTCVDGIDSHSCVCNDGFEGDNCTGM